MKEKKQISMQRSFLNSYLLPELILSLNLLITMILLIIYAKTKSIVLLIVAIVYASLLTILYLLFSILSYRRMRKIYYDGLYLTTSSVLRGLKNNIASNEQYPNTSILEINNLNEELKQVNTIISNSTLITADLESAYIPLVFISEKKRIVTLASFKNEMRSIIYCSQNFRNVLIEIFYDLDESTLSEEESGRLIDVISNLFVDYKHFIFAPNDNGTGYYLFLPRIDSFSHIKESLLSSMKNISITRKTFDGLVTINARFSITCYPYSDINELFPDLMYAKRQGEIINLYTPNRLSALSENRVLQNSLNLNNMSRILETISDVKFNQKERNNSYKIIQQTLSSIITYLSIDFAGVILYDGVNDYYYSKIHVHQPKNALFPKDSPVDNNFISALKSVQDRDNSFYFSSRKHTGFILGKCLDIINISSGFYYLVYDPNDNLIGVIYFFNRDKNLIIDSYIREALFVLSYRIGDFLNVSYEEDNVAETYHEINNILMESNFTLYRIDRLNFDLMGYSTHMPSLFPNVKINQKCYKALYGLDVQCPNCPLRTNSKMISKIKNSTIETSLTLNNSKTRLIRMVIRQLKDDEERGDRFDRDLLINSYYSLKITLDDLFAIGSRGYLIVLRIDNHDMLLNEIGSEDYLYLLRQFIRNVKDIQLMNANIFHFANQSLAILIPEAGQVNVVNFVEKIYDVSKTSYRFNDIDYELDISYLLFTYPLQYSSAADFLRYTLRYYNELQYPINKNMLILPDSNYIRSASRNDFMLSVIDEQFGSKTFSVALQPLVKTADRNIFGAELLIRLSDNYRNSVFNADELIKVAGQNGKISLISNALIDYIGGLYQQYSQTVFKTSGFQRLTMNTDFSFFEDQAFLQKLYDSFVKYSFQKYFLGFEITEREINAHLKEFKNIAKGILNHHIVLICDQYSGEYLSIDVLKELGFNEIKIGRNLVGDIEINPKHLNEVTSIDKLAKENDLKVTFVGVENSDQYFLIKDMDNNCMCQGYFFYRPLEDYRLIDELRKNK